MHEALLIGPAAAQQPVHGAELRFGMCSALSRSFVTRQLPVCRRCLPCPACTSFTLAVWSHGYGSRAAPRLALSARRQYSSRASETVVSRGVCMKALFFAFQRRPIGQIVLMAFVAELLASPTYERSFDS